jgi:hypothetical protein
MTEQQPAQTSEAPRLDMPVPSLPDINWQRSQPVQMIPSEKRMKASAFGGQPQEQRRGTARDPSTGT